MAADGAGVALVVGHDPLEGFDVDVPPAGVDQFPQALQPVDRVGAGRGFVGGEFGGQIVVGVQPSVRVVVGVQGDSLGANLGVGDVPLAVAKHHVGRRAGAVLFQDVQAVVQSALFEQHALERVVRQAQAPRSPAHGVGEVGHAQLVHAHVSELAGEGEGDGAGPSVGGFEVEDDSQVGELGRQILVLAGQWRSAPGGRTREGEGGAAVAQGGTDRFAARLADHGFGESDPGPVGQAANFFDEERIEGFDMRLEGEGTAAQFAAVPAGGLLDPQQVFAHERSCLGSVLVSHFIGAAGDLDEWKAVHG